MAAQPNGPIAGQEGGSSGQSPNPPVGVWGDSGSGIGVWGSSNSYYGVYAYSNSNAAVYGSSDNFHGVTGYSASSCDGVHGLSNGAGNGVYGRSDGGGFAGYFEGLVTVTQNLSANNLSLGGSINKNGSCNFKIDHPIDPADKYLYHCAVESPDMKNIYDGVVALDAEGAAVVELPAWFEALNQDFRYQLTPIGAPGPNLYVAQEINGRRFTISGGAAGMRVSWQVTGIRHDVYAEAHRSPVEQDKAETERGFYLHPELFGQPPEKHVEWARRPELMRRMKEEREQTKRSVPYADPVIPDAVRKAGDLLASPRR